MNLTEYIQDVKSGRISVVKTISSILNEAKSSPEHFRVITKQYALERAEKIEKTKEGRLAGVPISIKDCICVKNIESSAGSEILQGYRPPFNATVIDKLEKEGAIIIGKTSQDEFGFGSFSVNTKKIPKNPLDISLGIIGMLSIFKNTVRWGTVLMGRSIIEITKEDYKYIKELLGK